MDVPNENKNTEKYKPVYMLYLSCYLLHEKNGKQTQCKHNDETGTQAEINKEG